MKIWVLLLLCIVQGLTEFLPVSSSGHLILFEKIFNIQGNLLLLNLFLHLATLLAVLILYRKTLWKLIKKPFQPLTLKLFISTLLTLVFAACYELLNLDRFVPKIYGFFFILTAILLFLTYQFQKKASTIKLGEVSYKSSIVVGLVQGLAVFPGLSRSGSTISAMILLGNDENEAAEYSFLLSIPVILGGFVFELLRLENIGEAFSLISPTFCIVAFLLTFLVSFVSLKITIKMLKDRKFNWFALYVFVVGIISIILSFT